MDDLERRQRRLDRAWIAIRIELFIALAVPVVAGFLFIAAPGCMCPMFSEPPLAGRVIPWVGIVMYVIGLVWMVRLSRPRADADEPSWRYRDRRERRLSLFALVALAVVVLGLFTAIEAGMTHAGAVYWWDDLRVGLRDLIRGIWATLTEQPETRDLFPF